MKKRTLVAVRDKFISKTCKYCGETVVNYKYWIDDDPDNGEYEIYDYLIPEHLIECAAEQKYPCKYNLCAHYEPEWGKCNIDRPERLTASTPSTIENNLVVECGDHANPRTSKHKVKDIIKAKYSKYSVKTSDDIDNQPEFKCYYYKPKTMFCPICASENIDMDFLEMRDKESPKYCVTCNDCGAKFSPASNKHLYLEKDKCVCDLKSETTMTFSNVMRHLESLYNYQPDERKIRIINDSLAEIKARGVSI